MNFSSSAPSDVPAIRIQGTDDASALFNGGEESFPDFNYLLQDASVYACSHGLQTEFLPSNPAELEDLSELSHLTTTPNQPYLTDTGYGIPYVIETPSADRLTTSCLGSPLPSPTPSIGSSLSPSSFCDPFSLPDNDSLLSPSPDADVRFWEMTYHSNEYLPLPTSLSADDASPFLPSPHDGPGPHRPRAKSSPARPGPVASKAMLEANGRRRRHAAPHTCEECGQTFTALFSLKRHHQSHTGERPFQCSIAGCSQRFFNNSDCKRHERSLKRHKELLAR